MGFALGDVFRSARRRRIQRGHWERRDLDCAVLSRVKSYLSEVSAHGSRCISLTAMSITSAFDANGKPLVFEQPWSDAQSIDQGFIG